MKNAEEELASLLAKEEYRLWYEARPPFIKDLIARYPWREYIVKEGAPYIITGPGSIVGLISYSESGEVQIGVPAEHYTQEAIDHIKDLCAHHGTDPTPILTSGTRAYVDPIWLEPIDPIGEIQDLLTIKKEEDG